MRVVRTLVGSVECDRIHIVEAPIPDQRPINIGNLYGTGILIKLGLIFNLVGIGASYLQLHKV
jgi:hypothetical protein